ncbi:MAG: peptide chain release factor N(5)-glutamine methyltransferase [Bacteroidales bacterium]|nr:peptide chain release factor N(5)-glutamine methyltransferase [Bacteroidales bacterium]
MLADRFPQREAEQLMRILVEDLFGIDLQRQLMEPDLRIDELQHAKLRTSVDRLLDGEPVQYVTGLAHFDGMAFQVNPSVLIPRPETEELVWKIIAELPVDQPLRIWDVGTGSGCIAIALAKRFPLAQVTAFEVSEQALTTARDNAERLQAAVDFVLDDVLNPQSETWNEPVDLVVSNPPYVMASERATMEQNVLDHEPATALFVPDEDPLLFYRQILSLAKPQLNNNGVVWFEINESLGEEMLRLCNEEGFQASLMEDYAEKPRFVKAML